MYSKLTMFHHVGVPVDAAGFARVCLNPSTHVMMCAVGLIQQAAH